MYKNLAHALLCMFKLNAIGVCTNTEIRFLQKKPSHKNIAKNTNSIFY